MLQLWSLLRVRAPPLNPCKIMRHCQTPRRQGACVAAKQVLPQLSPHCGIQEEIMARKGSRPEVSRRKFLAGAAVAGAAASTSVAQAATPDRESVGEGK